jgi:hypothetical protein
MAVTTLPFNARNVTILAKGEENHEAAGIHHARWWHSGGMATRSACAAAGDAGRRGLAEAGYVEGKNVTIEYRFSNFRPELMAEGASDVVRLNVNAIFAPTPESGAAARNATASIPIVALDLESDPLSKGYVRSLARPGGNITGMYLDLPELGGK